MKLLFQEIRRNPLLWLLVFVPIALAAEKFNQEAHTQHFVLSVLAILPLASLEKLGGISHADAVTVGDTRFDIEAAKKAGLKTIALLCGGTPESGLRQAGVIAIYRDPADFLADYDEAVNKSKR